MNLKLFVFCGSKSQLCQTHIEMRMEPEPTSKVNHYITLNHLETLLLKCQELIIIIIIINGGLFFTDFLKNVYTIGSGWAWDSNFIYL